MAGTPQKVVQMKPVDPAGLDQVLVAAARAAVQWADRRLGQSGFRLELETRLFNGEDGLGAVIQRAAQEHGVPNQRFPELLKSIRPMQVAERVGLLKKRRTRKGIK